MEIEGYSVLWRLLRYTAWFDRHKSVTPSTHYFNRVESKQIWTENSGKNSNILSQKNADLQCLSEVIPYYFCNTFTLWFNRMQKLLVL